MNVLSSHQLETVQQVKARVRGMLEERARLERERPDDQSVAPSAYWSDFCRQFRYLLGMADEDFDLFRLHTYHLDGDQYITYYLGTPDRFRRRYAYDALIGPVPARLRLSAPRCLGEYGFEIDGRVVNLTVVRMQRVVNTLHRHGILDALGDGRPAVLEIGAGYGALAYHLSRIVPGNRYYIVDLPEVLLFSAVYLSIAAPERSLYLWDGGRDQPDLGASDFVLVPNYALSALAGTKFELALNVASFQEMRPAQLQTYLDFCATTTERLYSWNQDSQDKNLERPNVTEELLRRFTVQEIAPRLSLRGQVYRTAQDLLMRFPDFAAYASPNRNNPEHEYLCTPKVRGEGVSARG
jgi:hypothetical protein